MKKKIIIISSYTKSLKIFRLDLIKSLIKNNFDVYALGPDSDEDVFNDLKRYNVELIQYPLKKDGLNPFADFKTILELRRIFKRIRPDYILPYTVKPVIYSNLAKRGLGIKSVNWITGLGFFAMPSKSYQEKLAKRLMTLLYRISLTSKETLVFQNKEDIDLFRKKKILRNHLYEITPGSGINLEEYFFSVPSLRTINFLFVGRLIKSKGIILFLESAAMVKRKYPNVSFTVVGWIDEESPDKISQVLVDKYEKSGIAKFTGKVDNVAEYIKESSVFVLPSTYREGVPRSILEALSIGRAVITTDNVGCRETVIDYYNGFLVEKKNEKELTEGMIFFCENPQQIHVYGKNSRKLAEEKFDVEKVNKIILQAINSDI